MGFRILRNDLRDRVAISLRQKAGRY
jgi:hypothetical protein